MLRNKSVHGLTAVGLDPSSSLCEAQITSMAHTHARAHTGFLLQEGGVRARGDKESEGQKVKHVGAPGINFVAQGLPKKGLTFYRLISGRLTKPFIIISDNLISLLYL